MVMPTQSTYAGSIIERELRFGAHNYEPLPVVLARGEGVWLWDVEGRRYLDMMGAYSAVSHGHRHPRLVAALTRQLSQLAVVSRAYYSEPLGLMLEELVTSSGLDAALPMNTGAEAVETAIKAVRRHAYMRRGIPDERAEIIVAHGNFHGRTTTIVGFSSEQSYREGFGPFAPGFVEVPFGDARAVEAAIGGNTAALLIEPIQGEAGVVVPPAGYLEELRTICDRSGIMLVFDEIQSGLGRTGRMFSFQHEDVRPDGLLVGKALGGGLLPVSAFVARRELMDVFDPGSHGSTFGGNPLAAAVAYEALRVLVEEGLIERSRTLGAYLLDSLSALKHPAIVEVRGKGLWAGLELDPQLAPARAVVLAMMRRGVLSKETHGSVVRFAPPLIIERQEIDLAVKTVSCAIADVVGDGAPRPKRNRDPRGAADAMKGDAMKGGK
jgi:ornithine--oxo-acid transaminase